MSDPTARRVAAALERPDESETAGREVFLIILGISASIGLFAQITDGAAGERIGAAIAVMVLMAAWLFAVHRVHRWQVEKPQRVVIMLTGVYIALIGLLLLDSAYLILLFGVYSLTFGFAVDLRLAAGLSFVVTIIWIGAWLFHELPTGAIVTPVLVWGTLVAIAAAMAKVSQQSAERRELLAEIHDTRAQLAEAERHAGVLAERQRVAGEIHDTIAQGFTSIVLLSQAMGAQANTLAPAVLAEKLGLVEQTARDNLAATRRLVEDLHPVELEVATLDQAIRQLAQRHQAATGTDVQVTVTGKSYPLGGTVDVAVLRAIQEALTNAGKYADADYVAINLIYHAASFEALVTDDGQGFDSSQPPTPVAGGVGGRGLGIMAERITSLGGTCTVESAPGAGTNVRIAVPTSQADPQETL